jgi:hypothetical protein
MTSQQQQLSRALLVATGPSATGAPELRLRTALASAGFHTLHARKVTLTRDAVLELRGLPANGEPGAALAAALPEWTGCVCDSLSPRCGRPLMMSRGVFCL